MKYRVIIIAIWVAILLAAGFYGLPTVLKSKDSYKGTIVFNTEEEYTHFKQELITSHADWIQETMQALTSQPPIIVKFSISVPQDYTFPYGQKTSDVLGNLVILAFFTFLALFIAYIFVGLAATGGVLILWLFKKQSQWKE